MLEIEAIYRQIGIRQNVLAFGGQIEKELKERFPVFLDENLKRLFFIYIKFKTNIYTIYSNIRYTVGYIHGFLSD